MLLAISLSVSPALAASADRPTVYGYHAYWSDSPATLDFSRLTHVAIFNVGFDSGGHLTHLSRWTDVAADVVEAAHAAGTKVHLCVTSFSDSEHDLVFGSSAVRATLIDELAAAVDAYGADGVNVDFEGLDAEHREAILDFVDELRPRVGEVVLATPAVDWSSAWDYAALSEAADGLFIMGYGYHYTGGGPGPNDPLYGDAPWSKWALDWTVEDYLQEGADPDRLILGLPLYGQAWEADHDIPGTATGEAWSVTMVDAVADADRYGPRYDEPSHSWYALPPGEQLWYPTHDSVEERIRFAIDGGLGGVGFWALDYEGRDPDFWDMVDEAAQWTDGRGDGSDGDTASSGGNGNPEGEDPGRATRFPAAGGCAASPLPLVGALLLGRRFRGARRARLR